MSKVLDRIRNEAALLEPGERAQLALELLESLGDETIPEDVDVAWMDEAVRRFEAFERGEMPTISAEDLHAGMPLPTAR